MICVPQRQARRSCSATQVGASSQLPVGKSASCPSPRTKFGGFPAFSPFGTALEVEGHGSSGGPLMIRQKGEFQMSGQKLSHQLFAALAALMMSSIAVGAAVAPETAVAATSVNVVSYV
jgi:hypothetical protein